MSTQRKRILTHVELFVTVAVVVLLIVLLVSAIQVSREHARRDACVENMQQLALALHNFHDARKKFPGATNTPWGDDPALAKSGPWGAPPEEGGSAG